jgi:hypothetical protein
MLEMKGWFMIRDLYTQGFSITAISDKTGFDWKTVKKYLNSTTIPEPKKRAKRESKLDKYKDYIIERLNEAPLTASRLFREMREMGFTGKCTIVKDFVRKVRPEQDVQAFASLWVLKLLQGGIHHSELESQFKEKLNAKDFLTLVDCVLNKPFGYRNRAITILFIGVRLRDES